MQPTLVQRSANDARRQHTDRAHNAGIKKHFTASRCVQNGDADGEAEADKADLVMVMVLLEDMDEFGESNDVYAAWLEGTILPARAAYGVRELPAGAKVEVIARAVRGSGSN